MIKGGAFAGGGSMGDWDPREGPIEVTCWTSNAYVSLHSDIDTPTG